MRVLVIVNQVSRDQSALWESLSERGVDLTLAGGKVREGLEVYKPVVDQPAVDVRQLNPIMIRRNRDHSWWFYRGIRGVLRESKSYDLVHVASELWALNVFQVLSSKLPTVVHGADNQFLFGTGFERAARKVALRANLQRVAGYVSWNRAGAELAKGLRPDLPTLICPAVAVRDLGSNLGRVAGEGEFIIGYAGRATHAKGLDTLLCAHDLLQESGFQHRLRVAGDGPLAQLESMRRLDVEWLGVLSQKQIYEFLSSLDVLVVPSRTMSRWREQYCRIAVEAMSVGVPVLHSNSGALGEVVGTGGETFEEDNPMSLARVLREWRRSDTSRRSALARRQYEEIHRPEELAEELHGFWSSIV